MKRKDGKGCTFAFARLCAGYMAKRWHALDERGQATVEAAFLLPVTFLLLLLLLQPGILLYDRMVMQGAAAEGCRLLATAGDASGTTEAQCQAYVRRRLGAVPQQDCFHVHDGGCTWSIELTGGESSQQVGVTITTEARPLPLIDGASTLLGLVNAQGNFVVEVSASMPTQPAWTQGAKAGSNPSGWIGAWLDEA